MAEKVWQKYLNHASAEMTANYRRMLDGADETSSWAKWQQVFLNWIDDYLDKELQKDVDLNIDKHEAGGQLRIAFPHVFVTGREDVYEYMKTLMEHRKAYTDTHYYHGFPDCAEVHHEIETFLYFQNAMALYRFPGYEAAIASVLDVAEHTGNWVSGVPAWYDWEKHGFTSTYLGGREVRNYPPHDYQEANHFRFLNEAAVAYRLTGEERYLQLIADYSDRWCRHIEACPTEGPIPCSILPEDAVFEEMGYSGNFVKSGKYQVFYNLVAANTVYDVVTGLMNAYELTKNERYLKNAEKMLEQLLLHSRNDRPATAYHNGKWLLPEDNRQAELEKKGLQTDDGSVSQLFFTGHHWIVDVMMYDHVLTGDAKYKNYIVKWADRIEEDRNEMDQIPLNLMTAAHYFTGDERYLQRAYRMALRTYPLCEEDDMFHQCNIVRRQGSKAAVMKLYPAIFGDQDFCVRGFLPHTVYRYLTDGVKKLPKGVSMRVWRAEKGHSFEAVNTSDRKACFSVVNGRDEKVSVTIDGKNVDRIELSAGETVKGWLA